MERLQLILTEPAWPELSPDVVIVVKEPIQIAGLARGTAKGLPTVFIRFDLPDGQIVIAETTLALFVGAANTLKAYYEHRKGDS